MIRAIGISNRGKIENVFFLIMNLLAFAKSTLTVQPTVESYILAAL